MLVSPQATMLTPTAQPSALPMPGAAPQPQPHESLLPKILPTAALAGLFLSGSGGLSGLSKTLSGGNIKSAAGGVAASLLQNQAKGMINPTLAQNLSELGVHDFEKVPGVANVAIPAINKNMETTLTHTPGSVDMSGFAQRASDLIDQDINISDPVRKKVLNILNSLNSTPAGVKYFAGEPNRVDALKELRVLDSVKSKAYSAWQSSIRSSKPDEEQHSVYNLLRDVTKGKPNLDETGQPVMDDNGQPKFEFDGLEKRIFGDEAGAPLPLDDMTKAQMIAKMEPLRATEPEIYANMATKVRSAKTLLEARHLMSDLTQGSIAHDKLSYGGGGGGMGSSSKDLAHGPLGIPAAVFAGTKSPLDAIGAALMQSHGANVGLTSLLSGIARK